jgi:hypothetical protein
MNFLYDNMNMQWKQSAISPGILLNRFKKSTTTIIYEILQLKLNIIVTFTFPKHVSTHSTCQPWFKTKTWLYT